MSQHVRLRIDTGLQVYFCDPQSLWQRGTNENTSGLQYNLRSVRAHLLKEEFHFFWSDLSPYWASRFLDQWYTRTLRSRIEPMKKIARMLCAHRALPEPKSTHRFAKELKIVLQRQYPDFRMQHLQVHRWPC